MGQPDLLMVCTSAFLAVFIMLTILAGVIRILIAVFPEPVATSSTDAAVLAAVTATVAAARPGARISSIEEIS